MKKKKAIEKIETILKIVNSKECNDYQFMLDVSDLKTIKNLIENQQKEIQELKEYNDEYKKELSEKYIRMLDIDVIEEAFSLIPKQKIKDEIEELKQDEEFYRKQNRMCDFEGNVIEYAIKVLQELLEEETKCQTKMKL